MARYDDRAALIAALNTKYGADNVGTSELVIDRAPYYKRVKSKWLENTNHPNSLYEIPVQIEGLDETVFPATVNFVERKPGGVCWFLNAMPDKSFTRGTFRKDVIEWLKSRAAYSIAKIIDVDEYFNGDKEESSAFVIAMNKTTPNHGVVYLLLQYNVNGSIVLNTAVTQDDMIAYITAIKHLREVG